MSSDSVIKVASERRHPKARARHCRRVPSALPDNHFSLSPLLLLRPSVFWQNALFQPIRPSVCQSVYRLSLYLSIHPLTLSVRLSFTPPSIRPSVYNPSIYALKLSIHPSSIHSFTHLHLSAHPTINASSPPTHPSVHPFILCILL